MRPQRHSWPMEDLAPPGSLSLRRESVLLVSLVEPEGATER